PPLAAVDPAAILSSPEAAVVTEPRVAEGPGTPTQEAQGPRSELLAHDLLRNGLRGRGIRSLNPTAGRRRPLLAPARQGAEDDVPERRGHAVAEAVVLEVVAHVLLAELLAESRAGDEVVHVVMGVVVGQVAEDEAAEDRKGGRAAEDQPEGEEEE